MYKVNSELLRQKLDKLGLTETEFCENFLVEKKYLQDLLQGNLPDMPLSQVLVVLNVTELKFADLFIKVN